jgi:hypothetical protein
MEKFKINTHKPKLFDKWVSDLNHKDFCFLATNLYEFKGNYVSEGTDYEYPQGVSTPVSVCFDTKEEALACSKKRLETLILNATEALKRLNNLELCN